jgi:hypothetical protein
MKTKEPHHPIQPLYKDKNGTIRFKENKIVRYLLDVATEKGVCDLNRLACMSFDKEERQQFAQLIGYSLSGYSELSSYVTDKAYATASLMYNEELTEAAARIVFLEQQLKSLMKMLKAPMSMLFGIHPDDLGNNDE